MFDAYCGDARDRDQDPRTSERRERRKDGDDDPTVLDPVRAGGQGPVTADDRSDGKQEHRSPEWKKDGSPRYTKWMTS